jgi:hypothetical protein
MNRITGDTAHRIHTSIHTLTARVDELLEHLRTGLDKRLATAIDEARAMVPPNRAVSDEDLRREVRPKVRAAWMDAATQGYVSVRQDLTHTSELLTETDRAARRGLPPAPSSDASESAQILFELKLLNVQLEYPPDTPLEELWDAYVSADGAGDQRSAAVLERRIESQLQRAAPTTGDVREGMRIKSERDRKRRELESRRERRLSDTDRGNLTAWRKELATLEQRLGEVQRMLIAHGRAV